ncbi:hypothetical protein [Bacteroides stercoris]|jgi:hypothetical protein|uniref:Uncharacterized protein n=1 Tax=Bacteroides stercoris TaxID=46506 RepID=A0A413UW83_BACSE|nr:hypothetical protein [Bacteroides stercoris]RHB24493.1 hypothetical protein DW889_15125 [Bacteroides stercoris]
MKQYVIKKTGRGTSPKNQKTYKQKKFRFPVALHLEQAVGALTLHTGVGTYMLTIGHKKCQRQSWRISPPVQNEVQCKDEHFI